MIEVATGVSFKKFCRDFPHDNSDISDLCSEVRCDPEAPDGDEALLAHLYKLMVDDPDLVKRLWRAYRRKLRKDGGRA
jgi:hypothetical protein